jgi:hypothetical protein
LIFVLNQISLANSNTKAENRNKKKRKQNKKKRRGGHQPNWAAPGAQSQAAAQHRPSQASPPMHLLPLSIFILLFLLHH